MKKNKIQWFFICLFIFSMGSTSCKRNYPEIEDPLSIKTAYLKGSWVATKIVQYDQEAIDNDFPVDVQSKELTSLYSFTDYKITFNLDDAGKPTTYQITPGNAPNYMGLSAGNWSVDNPVFTRQITCFDNNLVANASLTVKRIENNQLVLRVERRDLQNNFFSFYEYTFARQ